VASLLPFAQTVGNKLPAMHESFFAQLLQTIQANVCCSAMPCDSCLRSSVDADGGSIAQRKPFRVRLPFPSDDLSSVVVAKDDPGPFGVTN